MDEYLTQLRELEADVTALESLGVTAIDAEHPSVREISGRATNSESEELEK
ncbi:hypothetical protein ACFV4K_18225 [Nocardia sp. NPDC059764]|uniref:hypothetical protein n=1 Tax=Nocardia sp. NPDC059764 TaxID=3346939 RepID=UPI003648CFCA